VTDVPAEQESALASGPTLPDPTTTADVERILSEFQKCCNNFLQRLRRCVEEGRISETPRKKTLHSLTRTLPCSWAWTIYFIPRITFRRPRLFTCCDNSTDDWPVEKAAESLLAQLNALAAHPSHRVA